MRKIQFAFAIVMLFSCTDPDKVADRMTDIPDARWGYVQIPEYAFTVDDNSRYYNYHLKLRMQKSYPYENLYLLVHMKSPDGRIQTQRVNFTLTDETGKPLGRSRGSVVDYDLPMLTQHRMQGNGQYILALEQNMRDSVIYGIESIGVRIRKGEPVF